MTIFGREPAVYIGLIEGALALLLSLNKFGLTTEKVALIMAVVVAVLGVYTAWVTKDTLLGVGVGLAKAIIVLGIGYGWAPSADLTAALIGAVALVIAFVQRTQTSPLAVPTFKSEPALAA